MKTYNPECDPGFRDENPPEDELSMSEQDEMMVAVLPPGAYTEFDWLEDHNHENGHYSNTCAECECTFIGHKRRVQCKMCFDHAVRRLTEQNRLLVEAARRATEAIETLDEDALGRHSTLGYPFRDELLEQLRAAAPPTDTTEEP